MLFRSEKALAHGGSDSGTSARVFASILTWMQEKKSEVFVVATANDITALPPELLRRGRFDEIFFLDLPNRRERREIFAVHLEKRRRLPESFDLDRLAEASEGYVGSELEQAVIDAIYRYLLSTFFSSLISTLKTPALSVAGIVKPWIYATFPSVPSFVIRILPLRICMCLSCS